MRCPDCGGEMVERQNPTAEQAWCGTWFDHPPVELGGCSRVRTILEPSAALLRQEDELHADHHARLGHVRCPTCERQPSRRPHFDNQPIYTSPEQQDRSEK